MQRNHDDSKELTDLLSYALTKNLKSSLPNLLLQAKQDLIANPKNNPLLLLFPTAIKKENVELYSLLIPYILAEINTQQDAQKLYDLILQIIHIKGTEFFKPLVPAILEHFRNNTSDNNVLMNIFTYDHIYNNKSVMTYLFLQCIEHNVWQPLIVVNDMLDSPLSMIAIKLDEPYLRQYLAFITRLEVRFLINLSDCSGATALHYLLDEAPSEHRDRKISLLCQNGAFIDIYNQEFERLEDNKRLMQRLKLENLEPARLQDVPPEADQNHFHYYLKLQQIAYCYQSLIDMLKDHIRSLPKKDTQPTHQFFSAADQLCKKALVATTLSATLIDSNILKYATSCLASLCVLNYAASKFFTTKPQPVRFNEEEKRLAYSLLRQCNQLINDYPIVVERDAIVILQNIVQKSNYDIDDIRDIHTFLKTWQYSCKAILASSKENLKIIAQVEINHACERNISNDDTQNRNGI